MERTLNPATHVARPAPILPPRVSWLVRLLPLWRHAAFLAASLGVFAGGAWVRLEVQQARKDLDRASRMILEASVLNDRLGLELEARRRAVAMESAASRLGLGPSAALDVVPLGTVSP